MGALILISGPNGSGKSLFAEELVRQTQGKRYYIATMQPHTEENLHRIEKHRRQRKDLGFTTLEISVNVGDAPVEDDSVVLLEDVSNLLANALFENGDTMEQAWQEICTLVSHCKLLFAVTIAELHAESYEGETAAYIRALEELNHRLEQSADAFVEMKDGKPVWKKQMLQRL